MEYLLILLFLLGLAIYLEWKYKIHLYSSRKERIIIPLVFFVIGIFWDSFAVLRGHWIFNFDTLTGVRVGYLPLEEYLFFLIIPYFILTIYRFLKKEV